MVEKSISKERTRKQERWGAGEKGSNSVYHEVKRAAHPPKYPLTSRHWDLPFKLWANFLDDRPAECFVKENVGSISRLVSPVSKFRQARHSDILGEVKGEKLVLVVGFGEPHVGIPDLAVHCVQERVVLQLIPPPWSRSCKRDRVVSKEVGATSSFA